MRQPSRRLQNLSAAIFSEMAARKKEVAQKRPVYDLSIGSPDQPPEGRLLATLLDAVQQPGAFGYALSEGTAAFRQEVARWYRYRFGVELAPDGEVHSLMGSQDGLAHFAWAWTDPGDMVLVPDPGYPIYEGSVHLAGAIPYRMPLRAENGYLPKLADIPEEIAARSKFMILNYPNNPVSAVATVDFFEEVVAFAKRHGIIVVHDLAYSEMAFDGYRPPSFLQAAGAKDVGIEFNSFSKSFNMAGCRMAYVVGNSEIIKPLAVVKSHIDYGVFLPVQEMAVEALRMDREAGGSNSVASVYQERRDVLLEALAEAGWVMEPPKATMFVWAPVPTGWTSRAFALALLEEAGVVVIPGSVFGDEGEGYVRIALVQSPEVLRQAARSIAASGLLTKQAGV
ncbi:aminotransferase class I/II-fold pyridoxal phosphate-dependent enzyme [Brevibacillus sp. SAFN-007a]|uniref:aminotransferase class I/II-fold pyridoxal phosphate-dependent enzyme n=1 Tax=Brevibacillus sp. SAFN-007a TaxID=3436862 RepID=UPI003F7E087B